MSIAAPSLSLEQYQKLPPDQRSRPLTDEEYSKLSPSQLEAGGLAAPHEGAPADFGGRVLPNPNHIQPRWDTEPTMPVTRLPNGVNFQHQNFQGNLPTDISNPPAADVQPVQGREIAAQTTGKPDYAALAKKHGGEAAVDYAALAAKHGGAVGETPAVAGKTEEPGILDREIPLTSYGNATLSGLQSIGRGVRGAVQGIGQALDPRIKTPEEALPGYRELRGLGQTAKQAMQVPAAIHDINASPDPAFHYGKAAQETAGEGAGQALTALAAEGIARTAPGALRTLGESSVPSRIVKTAGKTAAGVASDIPIVRQLGKIKGNWEATAPKPTFPGASLPEAPPASIAQAKGLQTGAVPAAEPSEALGRIASLEATPEPSVRALPKAYDATGENRPFAGGMDEAPVPKPQPEANARGQEGIASPSQAATADPVLGRLQDHAQQIEATPRIPEPEQNLADLGKKSIAQVKARGIGEPVASPSETESSFKARLSKKADAMKAKGEQPRSVTTNGSSESDASQEAINAVKSQKQQGIHRFAIDMRSNIERPLVGLNGRDVTAGPYEVIVDRGPEGETIIDQGAKTGGYKMKKAKP